MKCWLMEKPPLHSTPLTGWAVAQRQGHTGGPIAQP